MAHFRDGAHTWLPSRGADDDTKISGLWRRGSLKYAQSLPLSNFFFSNFFEDTYQWVKIERRENPKRAHLKRLR